VTLLLDTHVLLWLAEGSEDLPPRSRELLESRAANEGLGVSAISFWETAMLERRGRIALSRPMLDWREAVLRAGIAEVNVAGEIAIEAVHLPGRLHADPADRIIVATARVQGCQLATRDQRLIEYGATGHASVVPV
jgi:PIN domain nuclease of toxin-antitoxin system